MSSSGTNVLGQRTLKRAKQNKFVADLLTVMKDCNAFKVIQKFLINCPDDQTSLATTCLTAFQFASKVYRPEVKISQVCSSRERSHMATRTLWSSVRNLWFHLEPKDPVLPAQYILEQTRGLNPTCITISARTPIPWRNQSDFPNLPPDSLTGLVAALQTSAGECSFYGAALTPTLALTLLPHR